MTMDSINEILDAIIRGSLLGFLAGFWLMGLLREYPKICVNLQTDVR